jgi:hypothetical protein
MTIEQLIAHHIAEETRFIDELIRESVDAIEHDFGPDPAYREQLRIWRARRLDILEAALRAGANRLS